MGQVARCFTLGIEIDRNEEAGFRAQGVFFRASHSCLRTLMM